MLLALQQQSQTQPYSQLLIKQITIYYIRNPNIVNSHRVFPSILAFLPSNPLETKRHIHPQIFSRWAGEWVFWYERARGAKLQSQYHESWNIHVTICS